VTEDEEAEIAATLDDHLEAMDAAGLDDRMKALSLVLAAFFLVADDCGDGRDKAVHFVRLVADGLAEGGLEDPTKLASVTAQRH
jgi:hypothetical protein